LLPPSSFVFAIVFLTAALPLRADAGVIAPLEHAGKNALTVTLEPLPGATPEPDDG